MIQSGAKCSMYNAQRSVIGLHWKVSFEVCLASLSKGHELQKCVIYVLTHMQSSSRAELVMHNLGRGSLVEVFKSRVVGSSRMVGRHQVEWLDDTKKNAWMTPTWWRF